MIGPLLFLYDKNLEYAKRLVADVEDEKLAYQPAAKMNHPAWVIGHLARTCDGLLKLLGEEPAGPPEWLALYGRDSQPSPDRGLYGSKAELLAALERGHERVKAALRAIDPQTLDRESPENYRARFPTLAHLVLHMLTGHEQMHLGQVSAWRRVQGLPAV